MYGKIGYKRKRHKEKVKKKVWKEEGSGGRERLRRKE